MCGACHAQLNQYQEAEKCFRKVVQLKPDLFNAWGNLGLALMYQKQYKEAEKCFKRASKIQPDYAPAYNNIGNLMREQGRLDEAIQLFKKALHYQANYPAAHNNLAITLHTKKDQKSAEAHARTAIQQNPNYPAAYHNLGDILSSQHQLIEAQQCYQQSLKLNPQLVETWYSMGTLLERMKQHNQAQDCFRHAIQLQPDFIKAHIRITRRMIRKNQFDDAMDYLLDLYNRHPDNNKINSEITHLLILQGDSEQACHRILPLLDQGQPPIIMAYAKISTKIDRQEDALQRLLALSQHKNLNQQFLSEVYFEIGNLYHKDKNYDSAFTYYRKGNELIDYQSDLQRHLQQMKQMTEFFTAERFDSLSHASLESERPVFIVGMPRSGTTLVEQILSSHPHAYGAGEITDLWNIVNALRVSDKLPHNFLYLSLIAILFPQARIIHCQRDAMDNCMSIYFHQFNEQHLYARQLGELGQYYRGYEGLMRHWHKALPMPILDLRYEDLVEDQVHYSRKLIEFCGLEWDDACLNFHQSERIANTPSNEQVRQPIYKSSMQRWKAYETHLGDLKDALNYKK
ncbi:MAG: tetratricopeptide repeat protein [Gammaproteobacteria bacterium]|nr:tetratricopeptide repeat protein [Gammaproteobacteria bacterium]